MVTPDAVAARSAREWRLRFSRIAATLMPMSARVAHAYRASPPLSPPPTKATTSARGRGRWVREVRSTEGPCHRRGGQRAARPRRRPGAYTDPGHRSPQPHGQSALRLSAPAGTSGRGRHMSTCLHYPTSSRASARFPTALAGTKPCAEAWEGLRSWDPPVSRQSRALWEPMRRSRATFTMRSSRRGRSRRRRARPGASPRWNLFDRRSCGASSPSSSLPRLRGSERAG